MISDRSKNPMCPSHVNTQKRHMQQTAKLTSVVILLLMSACSSFPTSKPLPPEVEIADVEIVKLGLKEQDLAFTLDVFNPNNYDLPVNTLEFSASSNEKLMATGRSVEPVLLKSKSNNEVVINVTAKANRLLSRLIASSLSSDSHLDYNVTGFVKLDNWPARIPFNVDKTYSLD